MVGVTKYDGRIQAIHSEAEGRAKFFINFHDGKNWNTMSLSADRDIFKIDQEVEIVIREK